MLWSSDLHKNLKVNSMWMIKTRWSKPGASNWNTKFVFLLPVELQIGAFVLMSWPLSSFSGRCPSSSMQSWKIMKWIGLYCSGKVCLIHELLLSGKLLSSKWHQYGVCQRVVGGTVLEQQCHFRWDFLAVPWKPAAGGTPWEGRTELAVRAIPLHQLRSKRATPAQGTAENQLPEDRRAFGHCLLAGHLEGPGKKGTQSSYDTQSWWS